MAFKFNEFGVCMNPEKVTYYEHPKRPAIDYCTVYLFQHPETGEWMGAPCFMNPKPAAGHHGCPSKNSLRRFLTKSQAELHYLDYMLGDQFKGLGGSYSDHSYLSQSGRRAAEFRRAELLPSVGSQLTLFS